MSTHVRTAWLLAWRSLRDRPLRSALLLLGYGVGVAVMIALLSVGDALLAQARDRDLAGGGDLVLLPEGVDPAVLKVNGVTGLYLTIPQAGFIVRDVLGGPRFGPDVQAAAPEIQNRVVYLRVRGRTVPASASAGVPSLDHATHATPAVPGIEDTAADRTWMASPPAFLFNRIDRFHRPPDRDRRSWAEWDYFNFLDPRSGAYGYLTFLAGGEGQGAILVRLRRPGLPPDDLAIPARLKPGDLSVKTASQRIGPGRIQAEAGRYHVTIADPHVRADLWLTPVPGVYLPPAEMAAGGVISGYVVPVLQGRMTGKISTARTTLHLNRAPAYHDHNWGTWQGVTWEWGEASGGAGPTGRGGASRNGGASGTGADSGGGGALLYGELHVAGGDGTGAGGRAPALFLWAPVRAAAGVPRRDGLLGVFPIRSLSYRGWHPGPVVDGRTVPAPQTITIIAGLGDSTVTVRIRVDDALGSVLRFNGTRTAGPAARVFLQMRGEAEVTGRVDGQPLAWHGPAASETFVPASGRAAGK
jgi:hypothetical protein